MKQITEYIQKKHIKTLVVPRVTSELVVIVRDRLKKNPAANLNDIDVSNIKVFDNLFMQELFHGKDIQYTFDVSEWDVSQATSMQSIFRNIDYKGDLSKWDVRNVLDFDHAFSDSKIDADLSNWNVSKEANTKAMFARTAIKEQYLPQTL